MGHIIKTKGIILIVTLLVISSCVSKKGTGYDKVDVKKFDAAAFDYVYVEALKQKLLGNGGDALRYMEQCIKINPESDAAYYQMAQIVLATGDLVNAKKYAERAFQIDEKNIWYITMLAGIHYQFGDIGNAILIYEKGVKYYPGKINYQVTLASMYAENKEYTKSHNIFRQLEYNYGINETITVPYIQSLLAAEQFNDAQNKAEELIREFPSGIKYYALMAEIYRMRGEGSKAQEVYEKLLKENPENSEIQLSVCDFLISEKRYDELFIMLTPVVLNMQIPKEEKISLFARLIEITDHKADEIDKILLSLMVLEANYSKDDIIPLLRPQFLGNIGRDKEAADRLEEIVNKNPGNYYAWERLLLLYLKMKDFKNLMIRGEECASKFNRSFLAKLLYANGAIENERYDIAIDELRKAQILAGDDKQSIMQVLTMRADVYYRMKDYNKAFEIFEEAISFDGEDLTILNNYAYYLAEQNIKLKEAEIMSRKVIEIEKDNSTFLDTYAWVLFKRGRIKDAAKIMESVIQKGINLSAEHYEHYGYILKSMKKCERAVENWRIALKLDSTKTELDKEIWNCKR